MGYYRCSCCGAWLDPEERCSCGASAGAADQTEINYIGKISVLRGYRLTKDLRLVPAHAIHEEGEQDAKS